MGRNTKYIIIYLAAISLLISVALQLAHAETQAEPPVELHQAKLDQMLAPIALYPDSLLSHILIGATYPLEVVQAARWREEHANLSEQQALDLAEQQDWDPSVIALTPFTELLERMSKDLNWLQDLGDAFLANEEQVLESVQTLRSRAYAKGNLQDNQYQNIEREQDKIVIHSVERETVYVPYYDTRVVYGDWWWTVHQPIFWRSPRHYTFHSGFHWSPRFHISAGFFFGGFHWRNNYVVINNDYRYRRSNHRYTYSKVRNYPRWQHNNHHRRSVKYHRGYNGTHKRAVTSRNVEMQKNRIHRDKVVSRLKHQQSARNHGHYKREQNAHNKQNAFSKKSADSKKKAHFEQSRKSNGETFSKRSSQANGRSYKIEQGRQKTEQLRTKPQRTIKSQRSEHHRVKHQSTDRNNGKNRYVSKPAKAVKRASQNKQHRTPSRMTKQSNRQSKTQSGKFNARRVEP